MAIMDLKVYTPEDGADLIRLAKEFHKTTYYAKLPFDEEKLLDLANKAITEAPKDNLCLFFQHGDRNVGFIAAMALEVPFSRARMSAEVGFWLEDTLSPYVRGKGGFRLLEGYEYWAKNIAKVDMIQLGSFRDQRISQLYEKRGFKHVEEAFIKGVK